MKIQSQVSSEFKELLGEHITHIGRASSMIWAGFGEEIEITNMNGSKRMVSTYYLHISSPCRFIDQSSESIIIGSGDIFLPSGGVWSEDFSWDIYGNNLYDIKASAFNSDALKDTVLSEYTIDAYGGIKLYFSNSILLEVFPNESLTTEHWRLINHKNGTHLVVFEEE